MIHRLAYTPIPTLSFHEALSDCLHHLDTIQQETPVLGVVFFVNADSLNTFLNQEATILKTMAAGERNLPSTILAQASESAIAMEVWADSQAENIEYVEFADRHYTRYTSGGGKALLALGLRTTPELSLQSQAEAVFQHVNNLLTQEGLGFTDIVRQWNYVPGILEMQSHGSKSLQHYQVFNEVRKDWYNKHTFTHGYPAATGIGVKTGPFSIDVLVQASHPDLDKKGLSNPNQHNAYQYEQHMLVGDALCGQQKNPPLFERAKLLADPSSAQVLVSGTAAILGQDTVGVGDVSLQTEVSIRNMLALITPDTTGTAAQFTFNGLRVYIKNMTDKDTVKSVCQRFFPDTPASYVQADVCRDNLLMEIEGEAAAQTDAP